MGHHYKSVELLLAAGADINKANNTGQTPLWLACDYFSSLLNNYLFVLAAGADPHCAANDGTAPFDRINKSYYVNYNSVT